MKKFLLFALMALLLPVVTWASTDGEGYPIVFLKGNVNSWQNVDAYRFSRSGDLYTLHINSLDGEFKIADDTWTDFDFGAKVAGTTISSNSSVELLAGGANLKASNLSNVTLKFRFNKTTGAITVLAIGCNGTVPDDPSFATTDPEPYPELYLLGDFYTPIWQAKPENKFSCTNGHYSITLPSLSGSFKIASADWAINWGCATENYYILESQNIIGVYNHYNFQAIIDEKVTISFDYPANPLANITINIAVSGETPVDPPVNNGYKVYFENNGNWTQPYAWAWNNNGILFANNKNWPGDPMTHVSGKTWVYNVPNATDASHPTMILFNNGGDIQTDDLVFENGKTYSWAGTSGPVHSDDMRPGVEPTGTLPVLYINVFNTDAEGNIITDEEGNKSLNYEVISRDLADKNYRTGEYWLDLKGCTWMDGAKSIGSAEEPLPLEIKARGNWTRLGFSKKPFKLKLGKKQNLLNINLAGEKSKHWAILTHADDNFGYLRNFVGFNLGRRMELPWTPNVQPIEVVINGDYRGIYFLTESIRIEAGRIDITELKDNVSDQALVSGGYLIELDNYQEENQIQMPESNTSRELWITYDTPEEYSDLQRRFVYDQFQKMDQRIGNHNADLWSYMDLDDAVRYYLCNEMVSHIESYHGSTYLFRDRGEGQKWHFSPLWDMGNAFNGPTNDYFYNHGLYGGSTWIGNIAQTPGFTDKTKETWKWFMANKFDGLYQDIDEYLNHIQAAAIRDHERWNNAPIPTDGISVVDNSDLSSRRAAAVAHLQAKINFLRSVYGDYSGTHAEPARDTTPAAELPEWARPLTNVPGDADGNGIVDATDIAYVIDFMLGIQNPEFKQDNADFDGNGKVNATDISLIIVKILGL